MKKVDQTYLLIRILKIPYNVWYLKSKFEKSRSNVLHPF